MGAADYIAAKFAKFAITQAAAQELGPFVHPCQRVVARRRGYRDVRASLKVWAQNDGISEEEYARTRMIEPSALGRLVKPEEVAAAALFLASDASFRHHRHNAPGQRRAGCEGEGRAPLLPGLRLGRGQGRLGPPTAP